MSSQATELSALRIVGRETPKAIGALSSMNEPIQVVRVNSRALRRTSRRSPAGAELAFYATWFNEQNRRDTKTLIHAAIEGHPHVRTFPSAVQQLHFWMCLAIGALR